MTQSPLTPSQRRKLWFRLAIRGGLIALLGAFCLWVLPPLLQLFAPFVCALVVAALLNPTIRGLQRRFGLGREVLALVVLGVVAAVMGGGISAILYVAVGELWALVSGWETILLHITQGVEQMDLLLNRFWQEVPPTLAEGVDTLYEQCIQWLRDSAPGLVERGASGAGQAVGEVPHLLLALLIFLLATYFLTADYPYLRTRVVGWMDEGLQNFFRDVQRTALAAFGGYLRAQLLLSVGVFFILLAGFFVIRQPYGVLIALGLAVLDFIPILGAGTVMVPWAFVALLTGERGQGAEIIVIWGVVALFRRVAEPKFVGNQTGLSPILSLVSIYVGMCIAGIWGMIFGPILTLILLNLSALGLFRGFFQDLLSATRDMAEFLGRP